MARPPGAVASTVNVLETGSDSLFPASVWVAVAVWLPSVNAVGASMVHRPPLLTTAVPTGVPPMLTGTVAPGPLVRAPVGVGSMLVAQSAGGAWGGGAGRAGSGQGKGRGEGEGERGG